MTDSEYIIDLIKEKGSLVNVVCNTDLLSEEYLFLHVDFLTGDNEGVVAKFSYNNSYGSGGILIIQLSIRKDSAKEDVNETFYIDELEKCMSYKVRRVINLIRNNLVV